MSVVFDSFFFRHCRGFGTSTSLIWTLLMCQIWTDSSFSGEGLAHSFHSFFSFHLIRSESRFNVALFVFKGPRMSDVPRLMWQLTSSTVVFQDAMLYRILYCINTPCVMFQLNINDECPVLLYYSSVLFFLNWCNLDILRKFKILMKPFTDVSSVSKQGSTCNWEVTWAVRSMSWTWQYWASYVFFKLFFFCGRATLQQTSF